MAISGLFKKKAEVVIGAKIFKGPPFSISLELSQSINESTKTTCSLYNPNDATIGSCDPVKTGKLTVYPNIRISAGYEGNFGIASEGLCKKYDIFRSENNRILEMQIFDNEKWRDTFLNKTFTNTKISVILNEIAQGRDSTININPADDKIINHIVQNRYISIVDLCAQAKAQFAIRNGRLVIQPKGFQEARTFKIDNDSGLVETPEKILRPKTKDEKEFNGYKIKTLFVYGLQIWSSILIQTPDTFFNGVKKTGLNIQGVVIGCTKRFSTFEDSVSEYIVKTKT